MVRIALWLLIGVLVGCGGPGGSRDSSKSPPPDPAVAGGDTLETVPEAAAWTVGIVDIPAGEGEISILESVRNARHDEFDRVVFQFRHGGLPGVHAEYVDHPVRQCGSGEVVKIAGDAWLLLRFTPAAAHTSEGLPTIESRRREVNLPTLKELDLTCDFEADVSWVLGVDSPNRFRVFSLADPPRVVVDIRH